MKLQELINEINQIVGVDYHNWYIGMTDDLIDLRARHGNPETPVHWFCEDEKEAGKIMDYFVNLGMSKDPASLAGVKSIYLYQK